MSDYDAVSSDLLSSILCKGRALGIKETKTASKRKSYMGFISELMERLMGELSKVRKFISDFIESHVGQSVREKR